MDPVADYRAYWKMQCLVSGGTVEETERLVSLQTPIPFAYPIRGILQFDGPPESLQRAVTPFLDQVLPFAVSVQDSSHCKVLESMGLRLNQDFAMVRSMVQDMGAPNHHVEWVDDASEFVTVQGAAHDIPKDGWKDLAASWNRAASQGDAHLMLVRVDGQAVGCGALFTGAGNAGLYAGSVLASHRRQGIARSIIQASMQRAKDLGLEHAVGSTTEDGHAFTTALGFETVDRLQQYVWFPGPPPS